MLILVWVLFSEVKSNGGHTLSFPISSFPVPLRLPSPRGFLPAPYRFTIKPSSHRPLLGSKTSTFSRSLIFYFLTFSTNPFSKSLLDIAESTKRGISDPAKLLTLRLRDDRNYSISTGILFKVQEPSVCRIDFDKLSLFNSLHRASIFGIDQIIVCSVAVGGCNIN